MKVDVNAKPLWPPYLHSFFTPNITNLTAAWTSEVTTILALFIPLKTSCMMLFMLAI